MTFDEQLPFIVFLVIAFAVGFPFFIVWLQYKARDKTLKQTYQDIAQNNPQIQAYLNQGYDLLAIVRDKGLIGVSFSVFDYPAKYDINTLPLFRFSCETSAISQFHNETCAKNLNTAHYTEWLPFQSQREVIEEAGFSLVQQSSIVFSKNQSTFLTILFPKTKVQEVFKKQMVATLTGTAIPEGQTWQWQSNNMSVEDDKLIDVSNNNRVLVATFPSKGLSTGEVTYLLIHPETPKHLVPAFTNLSILVSRNSSN